MEPFFDLFYCHKSIRQFVNISENINFPRYFKFFFRKLQQQVVIVHGSNNVILQKYEGYHFTKQMMLIFHLVWVLFSQTKCHF